MSSHIQLQNLQDGITQLRKIHELTPRNWHSANALPCNGYNRNKRCQFSTQVCIYIHRHIDKPVFVIPVKDICGKTLVHEYIYKVYLPFRRTEKFLSDSSTSFINKHWKNLAKALAFTHIQSSLRNPRANGRIENMHNFLKRTMKKIRYSDKTIKWHEAIQIAVHFYNTFPSASNAHSSFLLHFSRECSNPLWNKLNPRNTIVRQGDITTSGHELHKLWKAHAAEIWKNRSKKETQK